MDNSKSEYRSIFKATAFLSGVQVFNIIIGIIRNKIVSMILGPSGMGIVGLLQSTSQTVNGFTNCGIPTSSVKNIAQAYERQEKTLLGKVVYIVKRLTTIAGSLAVMVMLALSPKLSQWSFGNDDFTLSFVCLSISLLFTQLTNAHIVIIKGCRRLKYYAKANIFGNLLSLIIAVPLYYTFGKGAIVPVLVLVSLSTFLLAFFYEKKLGITDIKPSSDEFKVISKDILKMGIPYAYSEIFPIIASYLIRIHVSGMGGVAEVGLYSAGFAILNGYVGMIFTAMSSDFVPRLSAIIDDNKACERAINSQIILSLLILFPILLLLIALSEFVVWVLYSSDFLQMTGMMCWGAIGMLFRTNSWCNGNLLVPKREVLFYWISAIASAAVYLVSSLWLYNVYGVTGLGLAFLFSQLFDSVGILIYVRIRYSITMDKSIYLMTIVFTAVLVLMLLCNVFYPHNVFCYVTEAIVIALAIVYSLLKLNKIMDIRGFLKAKFKK